MEKQNPFKSKLEQGFLDRTASLCIGVWRRLQTIWLRWAHLNQHSPWFIPFLGIVIFIDAIVVVLPGDVILILAVLSNPSAWKRIMVSGIIGGTLGAMTLYSVVDGFGADWVFELNDKMGMGEAWHHATALFNKYGLATLAIGGAIPGASWAPVVVAGLSESPPGLVFVYLLTGRAIRYFIFCFGTREGWAIMHTIREKAKKESQTALKASPPNEAGPEIR